MCSADWCTMPCPEQRVCGGGRVALTGDYGVGLGHTGGQVRAGAGGQAGLRLVVSRMGWEGVLVGLQ